MIIKIDDIEYNIKMSEADKYKLNSFLQQKQIEQQHLIGMEKAKDNQSFYYLNEVNNPIEGDALYLYNKSFSEEDLYEIANYYTDEDLCEEDGLKNILLNQLRRYARMCNKNRLDWNCFQQDKYYITYDYSINKLKVYSTNIDRQIHEVYFINKDDAYNAIEKFKNYLLCYYTKYNC